MDEIKIAAFCDELEKIAEEAEDKNKITKKKLKRLARYGAAGAAGMGVGYATGRYLGKPIQKKMLQWGAGPKAAKLVRYGVPTSAGLGAALLIARKTMGDELMKKVQQDDNP